MNNVVPGGVLKTHKPFIAATGYNGKTSEIHTMQFLGFLLICDLFIGGICSLMYRTGVFRNGKNSV